MIIAFEIPDCSIVYSLFLIIIHYKLLFTYSSEQMFHGDLLVSLHYGLICLLVESLIQPGMLFILMLPDL